MNTLNRQVSAPHGATTTCTRWPVVRRVVPVHHHEGSGIGYSLHAGMVVVADGTREAEAKDDKLERVLTCDPGPGVVRHADAGRPDATRWLHARTIDMPMGTPGGA